MVGLEQPVPLGDYILDTPSGLNHNEFKELSRVDPFRSLLSR